MSNNQSSNLFILECIMDNDFFVDISKLEKYKVTQLELKKATDKILLDEEDEEGWDTVIHYCIYEMVMVDGINPIDDDELTYNRDFIGFWYDSDESSATPDVGTALSSGSWNNTRDATDSTTAAYTSGVPAKSGVISSDDGLYRSGPKNDSTIQGWDVLGAVWTMRAKKSGGFDIFGQSGILKYGAHATASSDGTTNFAAQTLSTSYKQWHVSKSIHDPETPLKTEWAQVGFEVGNPGGSKQVITTALRCYMFFQILRDVKDNQVIRPVRHRADPAPF